MTVAGGVEVLAPAKLNLFLEVLGRRPDGYHEIESLMVAVNLYDTPDVRRRPVGARSRFGATTRRLPTGPDNLVVQGRRAAEGRDGLSARGAGSTLEKAIPAQAGLAGGSSDAAATLVGPRPALGPADAPRPARRAGRRRSAATWRSSCTAPAAVCRGRGERVEPLPLPQPLHFVLVCPPVGLSTADVYRHLTPPERPRPIGPVLEALAAGRTGRPGSEPVQPAPTGRRDALPRARRGCGTPWRTWARRSTGT